MKLIYFHGGGLVSGQKDDLPKHISDFFINMGFDIIALDYPLAPAHKVDDIISWCLDNIPDDEDCIYFGRSAGSFLMFSCALVKKTIALIDFYGYARINKEWMSRSIYTDLPLISRKDYDLYKSMNSPFSVYVYLRQQGLWFDELGAKEQEIKLSNMPPTFIWHSLLDPDVPYKEAKWISEQTPNNYLQTSFIPKHEIDLIEFDTIKDKLIEFLSPFLYPRE